MKIGHRHYNNLIKELYWWVVERFCDPYGNPKWARYDMIDCETGKIWKKGVKFRWGKGFDLSPCTPEAKRNMKKVHKEKGKLEYPEFQVLDPITKEEADLMLEKGRIGGVK